MTIREAAESLRARRFSSVELTTSAIGRIESCNPELNAFITITAERALDRARLADIELAAGRDRGPLHGIPIALKDLFATRGVRTTAGSKVYEHYVPGADATVVEKLEAAGAVSLGKLNLHELAYGITSANPHFGAVRNQPVECGAHSRRIERRVGRGSGRGAGVRRHGHRYGRLHPHSGVLLRDRGVEAHLRPGEPSRGFPAWVQPGPHGPAHAIGARCRDGVERHRRTR
ncbi:hypothetical protein SBA4_3550008 [Candidatus Sulfopaludibacter sp. SbA4]|nr:hypothetical protein SBA4_3550008 [Candidatus Sulfopaludibacter sp. SbA4]